MTCTKQVTAVFAAITYQLKVYINPIEGGQVDFTPPLSDAGYPAGTRVTVTAVANKGFQFSEWTGDISSEDISTSITIDDNKDITVDFTGKKPLSASWWAKTIGLGAGIIIVVGLAVFLIIRIINVKQKLA